MARYNEILTGRYNRFAQKLFGMKGDAVIPQLSSDVQTVLQLFNGSENRYLEGWNKFACRVAIAANVGFSPQLRIRNPVGSNVIAVIEKAYFSVQALTVMSAQMSKATSSVQLASSPVVVALDARGNPGSSLLLSFSNADAVIGSVIFSATSSGQNDVEEILTKNQELPLLPGDVYVMSLSVTNTIGDFSVSWRERFLEESERT